jgi:hypothetical protein
LRCPRNLPMRCQPPLASPAQIGHSCVVRLVISIEPSRMPNGGLARLGPACRPAWQWRLVTGRCTRFHRAHEQTEPEGRGCANERLADSRPHTVRGFEPARGGITSCRPPGIPGAGFVLAQEFEGVMT